VHDYASPTLNGLAIEYGLVPRGRSEKNSRTIVEENRRGRFQAFDLGIPPMLVPVVARDYLQPEAIGMPHRDDGTERWRLHERRDHAGQTLHFLAANYRIGEKRRADKLLPRNARETVAR